MKLYKQLKFKMKLAYEAWSHNLEVGTLIHYAVLKTLQQKLRDTTRLLKDYIKDPRFNSQHRLLSESDHSDVVVRTKPDHKRLKNHIHIITYYVNSGFIDELFVEEYCKL